MKRVIIFTILILSSIFLLENHTQPQTQGKPSSSYSRPRYVQGEILDRILIKSSVGRSFIRAYDRYSPALAGIVEEHETLRVVIRFGLLPLVAYGYWSIVIGHGITLTLFSGLFLMPVIGLGQKRRAQAAAIRS